MNARNYRKLMVLIAFLIMGSGLFVHAQGIDAVTGQAWDASVTHAKAPPSSNGGPQILWDTHHGIYLNYSPSGDFSTLTTLLTNLGYVMDENNQGVHNVNLDAYAIVVIGVPSAWNSVYTSQEVLAIQQFVQGGGGLLLIGENAGCPNGNINPVASVFGLTCGVSTITPLDTYVTDFDPHPVFNDIAEIYLRAAGEIAAAAPSTDIARYNSLPVVAQAEAGTGGRVLCIGDCGPFANAYIGMSGNEIFSLNVFDWLNEGLSLGTDVSTISAGTGGVVHFYLDAGQANAYRNYLLLGGVTGTSPGTPLPGGMATLPLNLDAFTDLVLAWLNTVLFQDFLGFLGQYGSATAILDTVGPLDPGYVGVIMYFAYTLNKPFDFASVPVTVEIVP